MPKVALVGCKNYDVQLIKEKLESTIVALGGLDKFIRPGQTILLKVNLLMKRTPEEATTTHPAFVEALGKILLAFGVKVIIGDSPGGPFNEKSLLGIYKTCGFADILCDGMILNENYESRNHYCQDAIMIKNLETIDVLHEVDAVISVSKLKTHGMTKFTGAVKNMYGIVPGLKKAEYHYTLPSIEDFSQMLVDVCLHANPILSFMDGIVAMEGAGPSGGDPREVGVILASTSPYHLDMVACQTVGIDPMEVPTIKRSLERGFIKETFNDIVMVMEPYQKYFVDDFKIPSISGVGLLKNKVPRWVDKIVDYVIKPKPVVHFKTCIGCGECAVCCPAHTIEMINRKPIIHLNDCIRCFCCQELCPAKAIEVHRHFIGKKLIKI